MLTEKLMQLERLIIERTRLEVAVSVIGWEVPIKVGLNSVLIGDRINELTSEIEKLKMNIVEVRNEHG